MVSEIADCKCLRADSDFSLRRDSIISFRKSCTSSDKFFDDDGDDGGGNILHSPSSVHKSYSENFDVLLPVSKDNTEFGVDFAFALIFWAAMTFLKSAITNEDNLGDTPQLIIFGI